MNSRQKGQRIELEMRRLLESHSFIVNQAPPSTKWNKQVDIFGRFDLEAITIKHPFFTFYFQVSTRWKTGPERANIETFPESNARKVFMVRRQDNEDFELRELLATGEWKAWSIGLFLSQFGRLKD